MMRWKDEKQEIEKQDKESLSGGRGCIEKWKQILKRV